LALAPVIPKKIKALSDVFVRNPDIVAEVLNRANGVCMMCDKKAPFIKISDGLPYLEIHHIKPLSEGGEDTLSNSVALCPNCHREAHFGLNKDNHANRLLSLMK